MKLHVGLMVLLSNLGPTVVAFGHHDDPTSQLRSVDNDYVIGSGILLEEEHEHPSVLVSVTYRGHAVPTEDHHVDERYFVVSGQVFLATETRPDGRLIDAVTVNIVPVTTITTSHHGVVKSVRKLPLEVRKDVDLGLNGSVSILARGWGRYSETPLFGEFKEDDLALLTKFSEIAVDIIGARLVAMREGGTFWGAQLTSAQVNGGLAWNMSKKTSLRFSIGGRGNAAAGRSGVENTLLAEYDVFSRLGLLLNTRHIKLGAQVDFGYHAFHAISQQHSHHHEHSAPHDDGAHGEHGHGYVLMGINGSF